MAAGGLLICINQRDLWLQEAETHSGQLRFMEAYYKIIGICYHLPELCENTEGVLTTPRKELEPQSRIKRMGGFLGHSSCLKRCTVNAFQWFPVSLLLLSLLDTDYSFCIFLSNSQGSYCQQSNQWWAAVWMVAVLSHTAVLLDSLFSHLVSSHSLWSCSPLCLACK